MDFASAYRDTKKRIVDVVAELPADQWTRPVPGCPAWTVRNLLAHNVGVAADIVAGRLDGAPGDAWTRAHIESRSERDVDELLGEWDAVLPGFLASVGPGGALEPMARVFATDLVTHEHDLRGALGQPRGADDETFEMALKGFAILFFNRLAAAGVPPVRLVDGDWSLAPRDSEPTVTVRAPRYEIYRGLSGRRSRSQVAAFDWSADPTPYLDLFNNFGPLPERDVVEG